MKEKGEEDKGRERREETKREGRRGGGRKVERRRKTNSQPGYKTNIQEWAKVG